MGMNIGYLTSNRTSSGDEVFTPFYAVDPILEYIPKNMTVWCPFDEDTSAFVQKFKETGYKVINTSLIAGQDFFTYTPDFDYDIIVSNPPFSKKDRVLKRLAEIGKPFMILLPLNSLQGQERYDVFKQGIEILTFDKRIDYHTNGNYKTYTKGNHFASCYFCKDVLPEKLIIKELIKYERPLI